MSAFLQAHATHPDWRMALALAQAQLEAQRRTLWGESEGSGATLGFVYFTCAYTPYAPALWQALQQQWPGVHWVGTAGIGVAASGVEYFDEPGLVLLLTRVPQEHFKVFSGAQPLGTWDAWTALVHADPRTPDMAELIAEMGDRTGAGYVFGGLTSTRGSPWQLADGLFEGGLSGVAFSREVRLLSRVTQGSQPVGPIRTVTAGQDHVVMELDGRPAMECLADDLDLDFSEPRQALPRLRGTLVGLGSPPDADAPHRSTTAGRLNFGEDVQVRHLIGLDPQRQAVVVADEVEPGMRLAFCRRDAEAARRDLVRICAEIREELSGADDDAALASEPNAPARRVLGALYVSCSGRGGPHFGGPSAELQIIQHALGDVPLVGFFAAGEIAHHHLYGYTGVLTVFVQDA